MSRCDVWLKRCADGAQVLTLGVVIFGYFYTVVPVFQKEKLQDALLKAQRRLLLVEFTLAVEEVQKPKSAAVPAPSPLLVGFPSIYKVDLEAFILKAQANWPDPHADVPLALKALAVKDEGRHFYQPEILQRLHQILDSKKPDLSCEPVIWTKYLSDDVNPEVFENGLSEEQEVTKLMATCMTKEITDVDTVVNQVYREDETQR
jgi:hypothetical protein